MKSGSVETFYAIVEKGDGREFRVRYPDFPSLVARARTIEKSTRLAAGVLRDEVRQRIDSTRGVPRPTSLQAIKDDPANRSSFVLKVPVKVPDVLKTPGKGADRRRTAPADRQQSRAKPTRTRS